MLEEVRALQGMLLWLTLRDALLLAAVTPEHRAGLFAPGALERRRALGVLPRSPGGGGPDPFAALVEHPQKAHPAALAAACNDLAAWAAENGARRTAVAFKQAAARLVPQSAAAALAVGEAASRAGQHARARSWLARAIALGRRSGERDVYVGAYLVLGRLLVEAARPEDARRAYLKAARAARRFGVPGAGGMAREGLFRIACAEGEAAHAARLGAGVANACERLARVGGVRP